MELPAAVLALASDLRWLLLLLLRRWLLLLWWYLLLLLLLLLRLWLRLPLLLL